MSREPERESTNGCWRGARASRPIPTAVAYPCEESALAGAIEAGEKGLIEPILVGPAAKIEAIARKAGIDLGDTQIVDAPDSPAAAGKAVELVRQGKAELLMKGSLHTDELLAAVVAGRPACARDAASATCSSWTSRPTTRS